VPRRRSKNSGGKEKRSLGKKRARATFSRKKKQTILHRRGNSTAAQTPVMKKTPGDSVGRGKKNPSLLERRIKEKSSGHARGTDG